MPVGSKNINKGFKADIGRGGHWFLFLQLAKEVILELESEVILCEHIQSKSLDE